MWWWWMMCTCSVSWPAYCVLRKGDDGQQIWLISVKLQTTNDRMRDRPSLLVIMAERGISYQSSIQRELVLDVVEEVEALVTYTVTTWISPLGRGITTCRWTWERWWEWVEGYPARISSGGDSLPVNTSCSHWIIHGLLRRHRNKTFSQHMWLQWDLITSFLFFFSQTKELDWMNSDNTQAAFNLYPAVDVEP